MWTWDSEQITHDQTCWTYDGTDGCNIEDTSTGRGSRRKSYRNNLQELGLERIKQEDEDITMFITSLITKGIL